MKIVFALTVNLKLTLDDSFTLGSELAYGNDEGKKVLPIKQLENE